MIYDYFVAAMRCSHCGTVSPATPDTNMQTQIRGDAYHTALAVGFELDPSEATPSNLVDAQYLPTGNPSVDGKLRLIELGPARRAAG